MVQLKLELAGAEAGDLDVLEAYGLGGRRLQHDVVAHLGHGGLHLGERGEAIALQAQGRGRGEIGDQVRAVARLHHEDVLAAPTTEHVIPGAAVEQLVAAVAGHVVVQAVADAGDGVIAPRAQDRQVLEVVRQHERHGRLDRVDPLVRILVGAVKGREDQVGVVAGQPVHLIVAAASQRIVAGGPGEGRVGRAVESVRRRPAGGQAQRQQLRPGQWAGHDGAPLKVAELRSGAHTRLGIDALVMTTQPQISPEPLLPDPAAKFQRDFKLLHLFRSPREVQRTIIA